jgi:hypothetical protein
MLRASPLATLALLGLLCAAQAACAHEYAPLIRAKKYAEVERATSSRLSTEPHNADALVARVDLILSQAQDSRYDDAVTLAEQCISAHPQQSNAMRQQVLGAKAMSSGIAPMATRAGRRFKKAVALTPATSMRARCCSTTRPGIVGGA